MRKFFSSNIFSAVFIFLFVVFSSVIRYFQLEFFTDYNFGSYNYNADYYIFNFHIFPKLLTYIVYSSVFIYFVVVLLFSLLKSGKGITTFSVAKDSENKILSVCSLFLAVAYFVCSIFYILDVKTLFAPDEDFSIVVIFIFMFQLLCCGTFIYFFCCLRFGRLFNKKNLLNIVFIFPILWSILRVLSIMSFKYFLMLTPRETLLTSLKTASVCLFFFYFGKFVVGMHSKNNENKLFFASYMAVFLSFVNILPKFVFYFKNIINSVGGFGSYYVYNVDVLKGYNFVFIDFCVAIFILMFLCSYRLAWKRNVK